MVLGTLLSRFLILVPDASASVAGVSMYVRSSTEMER